MSENHTSVVNFASAVNKILRDYGEDVRLAVIESVEFVARDATWKLKTAGGFKGVKYRRSWKNQIKKRVGYTDATVFNEKHYQLTHLLEFGHAIKRGGRKIGEADAFEHIAPINDKIPEMFEKELKARI